jgi:hypothetical protein
MTKTDKPKLSDDPELAAFFRAVDRGYGHAPTSKAKPAPPVSGPQPIRERPDVKPIREGSEPQPSSIRADRMPLGQAPQAPRPTVIPLPAAGSAPREPDPNLVALARIWHRLSERDRQELMWLARLKLELDE